MIFMIKLDSPKIPHYIFANISKSQTFLGPSLLDKGFTSVVLPWKSWMDIVSSFDKGRKQFRNNIESS